MRQYNYAFFATEEQIPAEVRSGNKAEYLVLEIGASTFYLQHWQLLQVRDAINKGIADSPARCHFDGCEEEHGKRTCMSCDRKGCDEHMAAVFCGPESDEIDGYVCSPTCPAKKAEAA